MTATANAATTNLARFQDLLRELFQFDRADLDFGIYRIMNHKRDAVEWFIAEQLPASVASELGSGQLARQTQAAAELAGAARQVRENISHYAIDDSGVLAEEHRNTSAGQRYLDAQSRAADSSHSRDAVEAAIYNHLYTFFSRYYDEGDFISKRRYSRNQRYAIPYNGEEVYLHWANSDQYYVKTDEHFRNYDWRAPNGVTVHFRLRNADVEQNNVKGDRRFFIPRISETEWDSDSAVITIPFEYRPLSGGEKVTYGTTKQQDKVITDAVSAIPEQLRDNTQATAALSGEHRPKGNGPVSHLEYHLRRYVRRNNADFFIHKDLAGFLNRELDFYLKNDVLNLDNLAVAGQDMAEGWFQQMRLTKAVGGRIIDFLAQIEDFQKMLWEKRKFVTETQYCITLGNIAPEFYPEIAATEAQWDEWRELLDVDGSDRSKAFLRAKPTLVLDTRHFTAEFVDRLLASFSDLNGATDGLLVHGDNWQALSLLREQYTGQITCVHIDPPYNTQTSGFLYKNDYQHSSWLAMMQNRILAAIPLLHESGTFLSHIDENEYELLHLLFSKIGIPDGGTIVWDKKNPMLGRRRIATQHEYVLWRTWNESSVYTRPKNLRMILNEAESIVKKHTVVNEQARHEFRTWISKKEGLTGGDRAYSLIDGNGRVFQSVAMGAPEPRIDPKFHIPLIHPATGKKCPVPANGWSRTPETLQKLIARDEVLFGNDESVQPRKKVYLTADTGRQLSSVISNSSRGKSDLDKLGLEFPYCHPLSLYEELFGAAASKTGDVVLDHFAGSGTTGHAVINLDREDGAHRKFVLVEMGEQFDTVLLPRIKKVTYTPEWKDGKPQRQATAEEAERSPRIVKYLKLESDEDALDSIEFDEPTDQLRLPEPSEEYLLRYMLSWETRNSDTLLNPAKLTSPFSYRLLVHANGEKRERTVDLSETFNYLLGLKVQKREVFGDDDRRYLVFRGETRAAAGRRVAVIWRETEGWAEADFARDRDFVAEHNLGRDADTVYVNGDSVIPGAKPVEPMFRARMFAGVNA